MIPALSQARDQTHIALIRRTRHDTTYTGVIGLWVYDFKMGIDENAFKAMTRLAEVRKYLL